MEESKAAKHPIADALEVFVFVRGVLITLATFAIGIAYVVMGHTAGRIVGGVILAAVVLYVAIIIRRFAKPS